MMAGTTRDTGVRREPRITPLRVYRGLRDRLRAGVHRNIVLAPCVLIGAALLIGACQAHGPGIDPQQSAAATSLPFVSGNVIRELGAGDNGTAYLVEINGQELVFKSVSNVTGSAAQNPQAIDNALRLVTPEEFGGVPGASSAYSAIMNISGTNRAGVVMPYFDGVTLEKAVAVSDVQIAKLRQIFFVDLPGLGKVSNDPNLGNILIGNDGESIALIDQRIVTNATGQDVPVSIRLYLDKLTAKLDHFAAVNAGTASGAAPAGGGAVLSDRMALLAEQIAEATPATSSSAQLRQAISQFWADESGSSVSLEAAATGFLNLGAALIAQLTILNALNPGQDVIWSEDQLFENIAFNVAQGLCSANPSATLCAPSTNLHRVTLSNGTSVWYGWQFTAIGYNASWVHTLQENGTYVIYDTMSGELRGTLLDDAGAPVPFIARPCPSTGAYIVTITNRNGTVSLRNAQVSGNVLQLLPGTGSCGQACNDFSNRRLCIEQGGRCAGSACRVPRPDGSGLVDTVGTCVEGVSFDGSAPPSCNNAAAPSACRTQCAAVNGYLDSSKRCWTTEPSQFAFALSSQHDVTISTACSAYPCNPYDNPGTCGEVGGFCRFDNTCVEDDLTSTGGAALGTCAGGQPFNAAFNKLMCGPAGGGPPPEPVCLDECDCCESYQCLADCAPREEVSASKLTHQWLFIDMAGTGTGSVTESSRGVTRTRPTALTVRGTSAGGPTVVLTAQPTPGSTFAGWSGDCASVSGNQCMVTPDRTHDVRAMFSPAAVNLTVSSATIVGYDATTATVAMSGSFAASGNQVNLMCTAGGFPAVFNASVTYQSTSLLYFIYPRVYAPPAPYLCQVRASVGAATSPWFTLSGFADLASSDVTAPFVYQVFQQSIMPACVSSPLGFCPGAAVSRSDAAVFLIRAAFGDSFSYTPWAYFDDVPWYDPAFKYVQKLRDLNITTGCGTRAYCGSALASRSDLAVFLIRAIQARAGKDVNAFGYPPGAFFSDVPANDGRFSFVQAMKASGITSGCTATTFCPTDAVTRSQLAVFLVRGLLPGVTLPDP